jgi:hypothetical protein
MIGDADSVRDTVDSRESPEATEPRPLPSVSLKIRLVLMSVFIVGWLMVFLPS